MATEKGAAVVERAHDEWFAAPGDARVRLSEAYSRLSDILKVGFGPALMEPYEGSRSQRLALRNLTSTLIGRYITAVTLRANNRPEVQIQEDIEAEVRLLKQIIRYYIISNPSLAAQQHGQRKIIEQVFDALFEDSAQNYPAFLPVRLRYIWEAAQGNRARFAADCISSLTERELVGLHARLHGTDSGSVLDPIVR